MTALSEANITAFLDSGKYEFGTFLQVLKSYHLSAKFDFDITGRILLASLSHFETNDFAMLLCNIPERVQNSKEFAATMEGLLKLEDAVERGQFDKFWAQLPLVEHVARSKSFEQDVRVQMLRTFSFTYQNTPLATVLKYINVSDAKALNAVADAGRVPIEIHGDRVKFAHNQFNNPNPPKSIEPISSAKLAEVLLVPSK